MSTKGKFVISLDFELFWGVRDSRTIEGYGKNILGVRQVIPRLLESFENYQVKGTFATVGFLFFKDKKELTGSLPSKIPNYRNKALSPYEGHFDLVGNDEKSDPYHFAADLIGLIHARLLHEIGTHTFSHYYCLEEGQYAVDFKADLEKACEAALRSGIKLTSLIFPRNQFNEQYLEVCKNAGIICFRGNEHSWIYETKNRDKNNAFRRAFKFLDTYINISGHNCYSDAYMKSKFPVNIPSSRFLRPFSSRLKALEGLRLKRIKSGMTHAAKNNLTYHLWWHPHNFGINQQENFDFLEKILVHYKELNAKYGFQSYTMSDLAKELIHG